MLIYYFHSIIQNHKALLNLRLCTQIRTPCLSYDSQIVYILTPLSFLKHYSYISRSLVLLSKPPTFHHSILSCTLSTCPPIYLSITTLPILWEHPIPAELYPLHSDLSEDLSLSILQSPSQSPKRVHISDRFALRSKPHTVCATKDNSQN